MKAAIIIGTTDMLVSSDYYLYYPGVGIIMLVSIQ